MAELRQRKAGNSPSAPPEPSTGAKPSTKARKGTRTGPAPLSKRFKSLLVFVALLAGAYLVRQRRRYIKPLPTTFAICSPGHRQQVLVDAGENRRAECVVVHEGLVAATGTLEDVRKEFGDIETKGQLYKGKGGGIRIIYLRRGELLMPGLIDAHAHILQNGEKASAVDLVGSESVQDVVNRIAEFIAKDPELLADRSRFILGLGWDQTRFGGNGEFPTADDLEQDPRLAGRPIYLKRIDVHALWVSPAIIQMLGPNLPSKVEGGLIVRLRSGAPSGIFVDNAMSLITAVVPPWTDADRMRFLKVTARQMLDSGLTSVHDASLSLGDIAFLTKLDQEKKLPIRIYGMVSCEPLNSFCGDKVERYDGDRFILRAIKIFTDGALGSWGAAMHEPYSDNPTERGIMISPEENMEPLVRKWVEKGFQVCSHGIGDRANTVVLDAYEKALQSGVAARDLRLRLEHAQIMTHEDIARAGRLGAISSVQPTHATSDMAYAEARIGPQRIKGAYAWKSLAAAGSPLALGSDFPVEQVSPFLGLYAATARKWLNGDSPHGEKGWYPEEGLSLSEALRGFTIGAAFASFQEDRVGSLDVGKEADFIVIHKDLFEMEDFEIPETEVKATVVGGRLWKGRLQ